MKQTGDKFSWVNGTFIPSDRQQMTIGEIIKYHDSLKELLESNDYPQEQGFALYKEFERWQNVYLIIKERYFKKYGYLNTDEIIDKYTINKINGEFE